MRCYCMICGRSLHGTDWCCHTCAKTHGLDAPFRLWPDWAKMLKREEQNERRYQREWGGLIVPLEERD